MEISIVKDTLHQLQILYNLVLNTLQDVENSITFCKLKSLHPSIISTHDLYQELEKISQYYKEQMPLEVKYENILAYEYLISVSCGIHSENIIYSLRIPINSKIKYEIFKLYSIPSEFESEYVTVIPDNKYVLKTVNDSVVVPLNNNCKQTDKFYQCLESDLSNHHSRCETGIILHESPSNCSLVKLRIKENYIEFIQEINQYLIIFAQPDKLLIVDKQDSETKMLHGIFLMKPEEATIYYKGNRLIHLSQTNGHPRILPTINFNLTKQKTPEMEIHLRKFTLQDIPLNPIIPITEYEMNNNNILWNIIICCIVIIIVIISCIIVYLVYKFKQFKAIPISDKPEPAVQEVKEKPLKFNI